MIDTGPTIALLEELISFPTVSSESNLDLIEWSVDRLTDAGARVEIISGADPKKANLFATFGPERAGGVVLSGHTDVVPSEGQPWTVDPFRMTHDGTRCYGRGTADMKGFLAACVAAAPMFGEANLRRPLHFAFTYDEETGCLGARELVRFLSEREAKPDLVIVGEPTSMRIIEGHKGCHEYTTTFRGLAGHGSVPSVGVNAVEYAVRYVKKLLEIRDALAARPLAGSRYDPPYTTVNVGRFAGGVAHNVIPDNASVDWEMRPVRSEDGVEIKRVLAEFTSETLLPEMRAVFPDAEITTEIIGEVDGLETMSENAARDLVATLTGSNDADVVSFGTEAGLFQSLGMSVVVCGPGSIEQAHKADEFIEIDQLAACERMLERLTVRLSH